MKNFEKQYSSKGAYHVRAKGFGRWWLRDNYRILSKYINRGDTVLDLACGDGCLSFFLKDNRIIGIDNSPTGIKLAKSIAKGEYMEGDMKSLPFEEALFDIVVCSLSFQYLVPKDLKVTLDEIKRVLKVKGKLILSYPNILKNRSPSPDAVELKYIKLKQILVEKGFGIDKEKGICFLIPSVIVRMSKVPILSLISWVVYKIATIGRFFPRHAYHYVFVCSKRKGGRI